MTRGPLATLSHAISMAAGGKDKGTYMVGSNTGGWDDVQVAAAKAAIGGFLLSRETLTVGQIEKSWRDGFDRVVNMFLDTRTSEAAFFAQNFQGLVLWRMSVSMDRGSWKSECIRLKDLVKSMTDDGIADNLTRVGLSPYATYGPARMRSLIRDWLNDLEAAADLAFGWTPESVMVLEDNMLGRQDVRRTEDISEDFGLPDADTLTAKLVAKKYEVIYDFPVVQEGLRLLSVAIGWIPAFRITFARARDNAYKPLTRALFTLAFIDQYFWKPGANRPVQLVRAFQADAEALGEAAMAGPYDSNGSKRTVHDVRVSAALAYGDPFVRDVEPGVTAARLRSGPQVFADDGPLDKEALAVHETAVLRLITSPNLRSSVDGKVEDGSIEIGSDRRRLQQARMALADSATAALAAVQRAQTITQLLERLIGAGFVPKACRAYDSALKTEFMRRRHVLRDQESVFDETQQAVGCVAAIGNAAYGLVETYGPGLDYLDAFLFSTGPENFEWNEFYAELGLPDGVITGVLSRSMSPQVFPTYVKGIRKTLEMELDSAEQLAVGAVVGGNSARESILLWFDRRAEELWGILPPVRPSTSSPLGNEDLGSLTNQQASATDSQGALNVDEATMAAAAAMATYPKPVSDKAVLRQPAFAKYVVASAGCDAVVSLASASFTAPHIATAIDVCVWARDFGGPDIGNFEGHRAKLNALVYALLPFSGDEPHTPTFADIASLETLLGDLHTVVVAAINALPEQARPLIPEKPTVANSSFLISAYATAARLSLESLAARTETLTETVSALIWSVADLMWTLKCFFEARFSLNNSYPGVVSVMVGSHDDKKVVGTWYLRDIMAAVAETYGDCADAIAETRVLSVSLRALEQETAKQLVMCKKLVSRASSISGPNAEKGPAARIYAAISADYVALHDIQTTLAAHVKHITVASVPPGLDSVVMVVNMAEKLTDVADASVDPQKLFFAALETASSSWKEVDQLYAKELTSLASTPSSEDEVYGEGRRSNALGVAERLDGATKKSPGPDDVILAIGDVLAEFPTYDMCRRDDCVQPFQLSTKYNVSAPTDLEGTPLKFGAVPPEGFDLDMAASDETLLRDWVSAATLTGIADSILTWARTPNGNGPAGGGLSVSAVDY
nr:tegument protein UL37 [Psittacid alphaherpesvirus 6]